MITAREEEENNNNNSDYNHLQTIYAFSVGNPLGNSGYDYIKLYSLDIERLVLLEIENDNEEIGQDL
jgi:hypothetical protein